MEYISITKDVQKKYKIIIFQMKGNELKIALHDIQGTLNKQLRIRNAIHCNILL